MLAEAATVRRVTLARLAATPTVIKGGSEPTDGHPSGTAAAVPGRGQQFLDARDLGGPAMEHKPERGKHAGAGARGTRRNRGAMG